MSRCDALGRCAGGGGRASEQSAQQNQGASELTCLAVSGAREWRTASQAMWQKLD